MNKEGSPILNNDWEDIHLRGSEPVPFREKTEEERQLEYFHQGEAIDMDYLLDINPSLRHYFAVFLDSGAASQVRVEINGEERTLIQFNEDPDRGEPRIGEWDEREYTDQ